MEIQSSSQRQIYLIRYNEIALKKGNRSFFERILVRNIKQQIKKSNSPMDPNTVTVRSHTLRGRIFIDAPKTPQSDQGLARVFGVHSYSPVLPTPTDLDEIQKAIREQYEAYLKNHPAPKTFRIDTRRGDKVLDKNSTEINHQMGRIVLDRSPGIQVDLKNPELTIGVEVRRDTSYIWTEKKPGQKGLPVGSNGKLLCLVSGGLDSPVAALYGMKRGCTVHFIHFHGAPFVGEEVREKVEDLVDCVNRFSPTHQKLYIVPFGKIQEKVALKTHPKMRTLLYRRLMIQIANQVADRIGAQGLITGESLGQVASQTLENLSATNAVSTIPVIRPLIGLDKEEIIESALKWETYETSIRPGADCCTLFADRNPVTKAVMDEVEEQESKIEIDALIQEGLDGMFKRESEL